MYFEKHHERMLLQHNKAIAEIDKQLKATAALVRVGMKIIIEDRKDFDFKLNALTESQMKTEEQMRNPLNIIPPDQRPRVPLRYADQRELLVSGLLDGGADIAQRPVVVDAPFEKGHVVLFANNPLYRGETIGSYALVLNTILNFDNLNAGRRLDPR